VLHLHTRRLCPLDAKMSSRTAEQGKQQAAVRQAQAACIMHRKHAGRQQGESPVEIHAHSAMDVHQSSASKFSRYWLAYVYLNTPCPPPCPSPGTSRTLP
jgi:hypothetical protein